MGLPVTDRIWILTGNALTIEFRLIGKEITGPVRKILSRPCEAFVKREGPPV